MSIVLSDGDCFSFLLKFELEKTVFTGGRIFEHLNPREGFSSSVNFSFTCILLCGTIKVICLSEY